MFVRVSVCERLSKVRTWFEPCRGESRCVRAGLWSLGVWSGGSFGLFVLENEVEFEEAWFQELEPAYGGGGG